MRRGRFAAAVAAGAVAAVPRVARAHSAGALGRTVLVEAAIALAIALAVGRHVWLDGGARRRSARALRAVGAATVTFVLVGLTAWLALSIPLYVFFGG